MRPGDVVYRVAGETWVIRQEQIVTAQFADKLDLIEETKARVWHDVWQALQSYVGAHKHQELSIRIDGPKVGQDGGPDYAVRTEGTPNFPERHVYFGVVVWCEARIAPLHATLRVGAGSPGIGGGGPQD